MSEEKLQKLVSALNELIDERAEAKAVEIIRAVGLREAGLPIAIEDDEPLWTPLEVARQIGEDVSTEEAQEKAVQKVYHLARSGYLKGVWFGPRKLRFKPSEVRKHIEQGGTKERAA